MNNSVRLNKVIIKNLKNVTMGEVRFLGKRSLETFEPDILGIYGQNGSGKTTLIDTLSILKQLLMGTKLHNDYINYIEFGHNSCSIDYEFSVIGNDNNQNNYTVTYSCILEKTSNPLTPNSLKSDELPMEEKAEIIAVRSEYISFSGNVNGTKRNFQVLADTTKSDPIISPQVKQDALVGKDKNVLNDLAVFKKMTYLNSQSFLFAKGTLDLIFTHCIDDTYKIILNTLRDYGNQYLFVVDTKISGLISLNLAIPFSFRIQNANEINFGSIAISLDKAKVIPQDQYELVSSIFGCMNIVLKQVIPGLSVEVEDLGPQIIEGGKQGRSIQLVSVRDGVRLPLRNESEGIKKIISILQLLIAMYNSPSMTVAVDELDSGIFEYLLGEILKIISESGKGQLIFTSHNLRPLELIKDKYICFTTTNKNDRFTKIKANGTNNLRNVYYRDILLGGHDKKLYDETKNYEIAAAFRMAGKPDGC